MAKNVYENSLVKGYVAKQMIFLDRSNTNPYSHEKDGKGETIFFDCDPQLDHVML
jgi:hypothetical protein